jgi:hypothetical protein
LTSYFTSIFASNNPFPNSAPTPNHIRDTHMPNPNSSDSGHNINLPEHNTQDLPRVTRFRYTNSIQTMREIYDIVKGMRSKAAPGPDGLTAAFYKSSWH